VGKRVTAAETGIHLKDMIRALQTEDIAIQIADMPQRTSYNGPQCLEAEIGYP